MSTGGIFALIQWNSAKRLKRAEFIDKIINITRFDKEIPHTMHTIEFAEKWYNKDFSHSDLQPKIDKLLSYIDYICYLYSSRNISRAEFKILKYKIAEICHSTSCRAYLWNLYHYSKKKLGTDCSFIYLIEYGLKNKHLPIEFKENSTDLYEKFIDF